MKEKAIELIEEAEKLAAIVRTKSDHGHDIANNALTGIYSTRSMVEYFDESKILEIMQDLRLTINKLRLALFAKDLSNVELNILINKTKINAGHNPSKSNDN